MLKGKLSLVTGAASGIGLEVARLFAQQAANVIMVDLNETVKSLVNELHKEDDTVTNSAYICDVSKSDQVNELFNNIKQQYPTLKAPNVVVNCAGYAQTVPFLELSENDFDRMISVHLKGTFLVSQAAAKVLVENFDGSKLEPLDTYATIINLSSVGAKNSIDNASHYCTAKAAIEGLTRSIAKELAKYKIRCNCVAPGFINTPLLKPYIEKDPAGAQIILALTPLGRLGEPVEVAQACLFLASDMSSYMTGESLGFRGGMFC